MKKNGKRALILLFWLAVWTVAAMAIDNDILMVTPVQTVVRLAELLRERAFYRSIGQSMIRIAAGFLGGFSAAVLFAALSAHFSIVEELLDPVMHLLKAIPVASFVVLLLIWWGSSFLSVAICFLVVLPNLYINVLEGIKNTDRGLLEMAEVYHLPVRNRFFYIYRPALKPFLYSGMKISLGMCWKSGVAAEVIGIPDYSIGERLYLSKIYLDTAGVFAWTAIVILLSVLFEKLILFVTRWFFDAYRPACRRPVFHAKNQIADGEDVIVAKDLSKSYDGKKIFSHVDAAIKRGQTCVLRQPSGSGKTTFLRLVAGLEKPSAGSLIVRGAVSMVFQEDRLCEQYDAVKNVELVCGDASRATEALRMLLPEDALQKPCASLSGGMRRRVALARAMEAESDLLLFDEPFTGMDEATRERAKSYLDARRRNRTILLVTHI